jgi:DMSO/TMAO reductase YedYZ molybdopterin-dependent catalytic subunit
MQDPKRAMARREWMRTAANGTLVVALGGMSYVIADDLTRAARAESRSDGRARVPPGQRVIQKLKPMGGEPGDPSSKSFRLKVYGEVEKPFTIDFASLLALPQSELAPDVHCVTGWSVLGAKMKGVKLKDLADKAKPKKSARHVIFEAAHGYTANVRIKEALAPSVMVVHKLEGRSLPRTHGGPVRVVVPDLYFWKSAKWLTGIRFVSRDEPGYWETRGYNNHADPWKEERYS